MTQDFALPTENRIQLNRWAASLGPAFDGKENSDDLPSYKTVFEMQKWTLSDHHDPCFVSTSGVIVEFTQAWEL